MRKAVPIVAGLAFLLIGCGGPKPPPVAQDKTEESGAKVSSDIVANSVFGDVSVRAVPDLCAGRARLQRGVAIVNDSCFTGDTNVVVCTDTTAPNAVMCAPRKGSLALAGAESDEVSYARVR